MMKHSYDIRDEGIVDFIKKLMYTNNQPLIYRLICALKRLYPTYITEYLLGVYYLEFGKVFVGTKSRYYEINVSYRRARKHLKRALRNNPQDADIQTAIGESYYKEMAFDSARSCFEKLLASHQNDARFAFMAMEANYLTEQYESVRSIYHAFDWNKCHDAQMIFWYGILNIYAAAQLGIFDISPNEMTRIRSVPIRDFPQNDIAEMVLLGSLYILGNYDELIQEYTCGAEQMRFLSDPFIELLQADTISEYNREEVVRKILDDFTPYHLVHHIVW